MKEIGSYEAKTKLPEILRQVEQGESFTITNRGKPVADLVPSKAAAEARISAAINNIRKAKRRIVSDATLKAYQEAGRK